MDHGKILGLGHIGLYVSDIARSRNFYENILGFECIFSYRNSGVTPVAFEKNGTCILEIVEKADVASRKDGNVDHIALSVENIEAVKAKLDAKGIVFEDPDITSCPECFPNGSKWILFRGPDGEHLEITEVAAYDTGNQ